jgi:hypothetical protein
VVEHEVRMLRALWLVARGHRDLRPGETALPYGQPVRLLMGVVLALSVVELAVVHVVVPWPAVRWVLLVLSAYGVLWLAGFVAALTAYPHAVGAATLRLRYATLADVAVPLTGTVTVRREYRGDLDRIVTVRGDELAVPVLNGTNVVVRLAEPTAVRIGPRRAATVSTVRFHADDPDAAVTALVG